MKLLFSNHKSGSSHRTSRLLCSAFTSSILLACATINAQLGPPITNNFSGNSDNYGSDTYPGNAQGWSVSWGVSSGTLAGSVQSTSPMSTNPNYLNFVLSGTSSKTAASRTYTTFDNENIDGLSPNPDSFSVQYMPHHLSFNYRVEYFETNGVQEDWTNDNSANDLVFLLGLSGSGHNSKQAVSASWLVGVFSTSPSVSTPFAVADQWVYFDGSTVNGTSTPGLDCGLYYPFGMNFTFDTVYHFDILNDPRDKVYQVTISSGGQTNISPWLHWPCFADPTQFSSQNDLTVGGGVNASTSSLSFSIDSILVQQMPPSQFPPRITQLAPFFYPPTQTNLASATVLGFTPQINPPIFFPASKGLSFVASTGGGGSNDMQYVVGSVDESTNALAYNLLVSGTTIPTSGVGLVLNGSNVSAGLSFSGPSNYRKVTYNGLLPNKVYSGTIYVTNSAGAYTSRGINFDTFDANSAIVIEAEDYNFGNGTDVRSGPGNGGGPSQNTETDSTTGGLFINNPSPSDYYNGAYINSASGYVDRVGNPNSVDYFYPGTPTNDNFSTSVNVYRQADQIQTSFANDYARQKYILSGARDYELTNMIQGEWMNYTRVFPPGNYTAYLRAASTYTSSGGLFTFSFDEVTSDPTTTNQTITNLGTFVVPYTGLDGVFTNVPLTTNATLVSNGIPIYLSGTNTLRLTAVNNANSKVWVNYLVLVPDATNSPSVAITSPNSGTSVPAGSNVTFTASASGSGGISQVQYFNGATSIGSSASPPYSVTWSSPATGKYSVYAVATSASGFTADSAPIIVNVGSVPKRVLFVYDDSTDGTSEASGLNSIDQYLTNIIFTNGWTTYLYAANAVTAGLNNVMNVGPEAANGFDLVVIDSVSGSSAVANVFRDVPVPVINFNNAEQGGRMALTKEFSVASGGFDYGVASSQSATMVVSSNDPAAAGYSGLQNMFINPDVANFGYPNENAVIILKETNAPALYAYDYYYKAGAEMCDGVIAPAVRYECFLGGTAASSPTNLTAFGSNIVAAAFTVAMANPSAFITAPVLITPTVAGGQVTIPFTGIATDSPSVYSLYGSPVATGPYTVINSAVITGPVGSQFQAVITEPTNRQYFYRILRQ